MLGSNDRMMNPVNDRGNKDTAQRFFQLFRKRYVRVLQEYQRKNKHLPETDNPKRETEGQGKANFPEITDGHRERMPP